MLDNICEAISGASTAAASATAEVAAAAGGKADAAVRTTTTIPARGGGEGTTRTALKLPASIINVTFTSWRVLALLVAKNVLQQFRAFDPHERGCS